MDNVIDVETHIVDAMRLSNKLVCSLRESKYRVTNGPVFLEYASAMFSDFLLNEKQNATYKVKHQSLEMSCDAFISQLRLSTYNDIEPDFKKSISELFTDWEKLIDDILSGAKARVSTYLNIEGRILENNDIREYGKKIISNEDLEVIFVVKKEEEKDESEDDKFKS